MREITVLEDPGAAVAERLTEAAVAGGQIVLTGGSTPRGAYALAAQADADWSRATVWFSDERMVPPDHPDSNFGMADADAAVPALQAPDRRADPGRARGRRGGRRLRGAAARAHGLGPALRPDPARHGPRQPHGVAVPRQARGRGARALRRARPARGHGAAGAARDADLPGPQRRARGRLPRRRRRQGRRRRALFTEPPDPDAPAGHVRPTAGSLFVFLDEAAAAKL